MAVYLMPEGQLKAVPLDWSQIETHLGEIARVLKKHAVFDTVSSTSDWALQQCSEPGQLPAVCLAETQQQGRGRRGRQWLSPRSANIYMSLAWSFPVSVERLGPLSLVTGIAMVRSLRLHGISAKLKWPNDVLVGNRKIAGILIESRVRERQSTQAVIGVGLNFAMQDEQAASVSQPWTDFSREHSARCPVGRNQLAADMLRHMIGIFDEFMEQGFSSLRNEWYEYDMCRDKTVEISHQGQARMGQALGVDEHGAIKIEMNGSVETFHSADISLRVQN